MSRPPTCSLRFKKPRVAELPVHETIVPFTHPHILIHWSRVSIPHMRHPPSSEIKQIMFCFLDEAHTGNHVSIVLILTTQLIPEPLRRSLAYPAVPTAAGTSSVQPSIRLHRRFPTEYLSWPRRDWWLFRRVWRADTLRSRSVRDPAPAGCQAAACAGVDHLHPEPCHPPVVSRQRDRSHP